MVWIYCHQHYCIDYNMGPFSKILSWSFATDVALIVAQNILFLQKLQPSLLIKNHYDSQTNFAKRPLPLGGCTQKMSNFILAQINDVSVHIWWIRCQKYVHTVFWETSMHPPLSLSLHHERHPLLCPSILWTSRNHTGQSNVCCLPTNGACILWSEELTWRGILLSFPLR